MKSVFYTIVLLLFFVLTAAAQEKPSRSAFLTEISDSQTLDNLIIKAGEKEIDGIFGSWSNEQSRLNGCTLNVYTQDLEIGKIEYSDGAELLPRLAKDLQKMFDRLKIQAKVKSVWREYLNISYQSSNFTGFVTVRGTFSKSSSNEDEFVLYFIVSEIFCNSVKK
ncbi:MAG TPA: hypothetical protein VGC97_24625 [Pyrinomonadaceae bacterium]|jgi:hypothetical protein